MQIFALFPLALSFHLIHCQSTLSATAYVGLVPDYPNYEAGPSNVYTAIDNATATAAVRDPCGPLHQPSPNAAGNTCNVSILHSESPAPYAVQCLTDYTNTQITFAACSNQTIPAICDKLADPAVQNGTWIWASASPPNVCYMGFYLPPYDGSAQKPDMNKCVNEIFRPMLGYCNPATGYEETEGMYNLGLINVRTKPDATQDGEAVDVGYPSYILATTQLTAETG
ncbi:hypothetical protein IMSHALPRED_003586 [Imshaugia aleurites]|uniref:Uncharacterized protein n=1 Tax=Imshaugia aleurites TaxID=172621 RepID=A0A8H3IE49_9LECA|nr:hypothetical protein IMSHALPRED_003586 [Imshaugia aleurites]